VLDVKEKLFEDIIDLFEDGEYPANHALCFTLFEFVVLMVKVWQFAVDA
jgi:hypothetical protein